MDDERPDRWERPAALGSEPSVSRARRPDVRARSHDEDHNLAPALEPFLNAFVDMIVEDLLALPSEQDP